ncbi:MAG TPA: lipase maturation factor family protein [Acidimicrobiales bacterium]|nr:lipase maturation factor family protein [Acidimicrobiales bacterium]
MPVWTADPSSDRWWRTEMEWLQAPNYELARLVLQRGLGATYLIAFLVAVNQFRPLLGARGLLPVPRLLAATPFWRTPSIFHLHYSDRFAAVLAWAGVALSAAAVLGLPEAGPPAVSLLAWLCLWALYLSFVNVGQTFYAFGWETLLCEAGFLAAFLGPADVAPPTIVLVAFRWLLFRLEFGAGLIKLRGDRCWRDLTCLHHHHETQPLPGPLSWYFHHLPGALHKLEVLANHGAQLVAPVLLFAPQPVAGVAAGAIVVTQLWLVLSGNFSWLNLVTIVIAAACVDDGLLGGVMPGGARDLAAPPGWHQALVAALGVALLVLSWQPVRNLASRQQRMNSSFNSLRLVNTYGAFGSVTKQRREVVLEGTDDPQAGPRATWKEYEFKGKPGDPQRRPPQVAPYHLRLDWLMWFVALRGSFDERWLVALVGKLLEGDRATLALLRYNPFPDVPPAAIRTTLYRYRFTTRQERKDTGAWWVRTRVGDYLPPLRLSSGGSLMAVPAPAASEVRRPRP